MPPPTLGPYLEDRLHLIREALQARFGDVLPVRTAPDRVIYAQGDPNDPEAEPSYFAAGYSIADDGSVVFERPQPVVRVDTFQPALSDETVSLMYALPGASGSAPGGKTPPPNVMKLPVNKRHQWVDIWNNAFKRCKDQGRADKDCESTAFAQANGFVLSDAGGWGDDSETVGLADKTTNKPWDGSESRWPDADSYCRSALIDENPSGEAKTKARCHLPVREPDGTLNLNAVRAASAALGGARGGVQASAAAKAAAQRKLDALKKANGIGMSDEDYALADAFTVTELRLDGGTLPVWQHIHTINEWAVPHPSGIKVKLTREMGNAIIDNFNRGVIRRRVPLDERHGTDQDGHALGLFEELRWGCEGEGLPGAPEPCGQGPLMYGRVDYNRLGEEKLTDRQYLYTSPQYALNYVDKETGREYGPALLAVAVTNNPFGRFRDVLGNPPMPIAASDTVPDDAPLLTGGLRPFTAHGGAPMPPEPAPPTQPPPPPTQHVNLADEVVSLKDALAAERSAREAIEARLGDERRVRQAQDVDVFLADQVRRGVPPAFVNSFRAILLRADPDQPALLNLDDPAGAPTVNLHQAIREALRHAPAMGLGALTRQSDVRPPNELVLEDQLYRAEVDRMRELSPVPMRERPSSNGTHAT